MEVRDAAARPGEGFFGRCGVDGVAFQHGDLVPTARERESGGQAGNAGSEHSNTARAHMPLVQRFDALGEPSAAIPAARQTLIGVKSAAGLASPSRRRFSAHPLDGVSAGLFPNSAVVVRDALRRAGHWHRQLANADRHRPAGARYVYLTFEGLRESRTIVDKHTRIRIALPSSEVAHCASCSSSPGRPGRHQHSDLSCRWRAECLLFGREVS